MSVDEMTTSDDMPDPLRCSFCNKPRVEVAKLVAASTGAVICNECVVTAVEKMVSSKPKH